MNMGEYNNNLANKTKNMRRYRKNIKKDKERYEATKQKDRLREQKERENLSKVKQKDKAVADELKWQKENNRGDSVLNKGLRILSKERDNKLQKANKWSEWKTKGTSNGEWEKEGRIKSSNVVHAY